ncbi:MAG: hypothetical protein GQ569_03830 [Methylococcaceae bacterium]|nr:hypothetical protein [Methylococcaceae bacterium]
MPHFLWVEDFKASETQRDENIISSTIDLVFGSRLDSQDFDGDDEYDARDFLEEKGITLKLNLLEALDFIHNPNELATIDFVVLDVDMPLKRNEQVDENNYLPELIEQYQSEEALKKIAGYQIYIDLVIELGFPKSHILFCSNHAGYFEEFTAKFKSSNIKFPELKQKEHKEGIANWLTNVHSDYFVLRRGIIEGCQYIIKNLAENELAFNNFIGEPEKQVTVDNMRDYLEVLTHFLPLREPEDKGGLYKLFVRTLSHEWEATEAKKIRGLAWIMKNTRNWITHNSNLFDALDERMLAYLFMVNMRLMFSFNEAVQPYEKILLGLFSEDALAAEVFKQQNANKLIPVDKKYLELKNRVLDERQDKNNHVQDGFYFNELANNLQQSKSSLRDDKALFSKLLYQMFWLTTSNPFISTGNRRKLLEIKFWAFNYRDKPYIFEIARHIYNRSFKGV